jgi:tetratricopeptide (TPR) repeat protein
MAALNEILQEAIDEKRVEANAFYLKDKEQYWKLKKEAWDLYPEPKAKWDEAYNLAKDFFTIFLYEKIFDEAKEWLDIMKLNVNNLHIFDLDLLYNEGKYYFETGSYEEAYKKWKKAVAKEKGSLRFFEGEDQKYKEFFEHPEKNIERSLPKTPDDYLKLSKF